MTEDNDKAITGAASQNAAVTDQIERSTALHQMYFDEMHDLLAKHFRISENSDEKKVLEAQAEMKNLLNSAENHLKESWFDAINSVSNYYTDLFAKLDPEGDELKDKTVETDEVSSSNTTLEIYKDIFPLQERMSVIKEYFKNEPEQWETINFVEVLFPHLKKYRLEAFTQRLPPPLVPGRLNQKHRCKLFIALEGHKNEKRIFEYICTGSGNSPESAELDAANTVQSHYLWKILDKPDQVPPAKLLMSALMEKAALAKVTTKFSAVATELGCGGDVRKT